MCPRPRMVARAPYNWLNSLADQSRTNRSHRAPATLIIGVVVVAASGAPYLLSARAARKEETTSGNFSEEREEAPISGFSGARAPRWALAKKKSLS